MVFNAEWLSYVYYVLVIVGMIILFITFGIHDQSALIGTQIGLSFAMLGVLLMLGYIYNLQSKSSNKGFFNSIIVLFNATSPFIFLLAILSFFLFLTIQFFDKISQNKVSNYYDSFSKMSVLFILMQMIVFYYGSKNANFKEKGMIEGKYASIMNLLAVINMIILLTVYSILTYFSTDG